MKYDPAGRRSYVSMMLVFCFFVGIIAGTFWINIMTEEIQEQLGAFGQAWTSGRTKVTLPSLVHIWPVLLKREMAAGFMWLVGMTLFAIPGFLAAAIFGGFSMAAIISLMTLQEGVWGLPVYILSVLPQAFFYVPVIAVLIFWGMDTQKKTHLAGFVVLSFAVAGGVFAELFLNPYIVAILRFLSI